MNTGLDPELLVLSDQIVVPAEFFLPPPVETDGILNELSWDNAAIEMRPKPSDHLDILAGRAGSLLRQAVVQMRLARRQNRVPPDSYISFMPAARLHFKARDLESVQHFGCSPASLITNDYGVTTVIPRQTAKETAVRTAGFHIHNELSYSDTAQPIVAILDGLLGLADVLFNHQQVWSSQSRMRRISIGYGRAGEYRLRTVGGQEILEYRVMSPWPMSSPRRMLWVTSIMKAVCRRELSTLLSVLDAFPDRHKITQAINEANPAQAVTLRQKCIAAWVETGGKRSARSDRFEHISMVKRSIYGAIPIGAPTGRTTGHGDASGNDSTASATAIPFPPHSTSPTNPTNVNDKLLKPLNGGPISEWFRFVQAQTARTSAHAQV